VRLLQRQRIGRYLRHGWRDGNALLLYKWRLLVCGIPVWWWQQRVREVPVWEWARSACLGDGIPDEGPQL